jgi:hypothetical protein
MVLGGQFDYEEDNQRALPFNVKITEISEEMKVHRGSTSKRCLMLIYIFFVITKGVRLAILADGHGNQPRNEGPQGIDK